MHVLLICNGEAPSRALCRRLARKADLIVAADGGANTARTRGIRPHVIIGDLDSMTPSTRSYFAGSQVVHVTRQDNTDFEKALDYVAERRAKEVTVIAATGRRIDFTLGNLSVIWKYVRLFEVSFVSDGWHAVPVSRKITVRSRKGTVVSLIPFGPCSGITLRGLEYPLRHASMRVGDIGVSNVVTRSPFTVEVTRGKMLLILFENK